MSGKSWHPTQPLRVSETAGAVWRAEFPHLAVWDAYRRGALSRTQAGEVEVTSHREGVVFCIAPDSQCDSGWLLKTIRAKG